VLDHVNNVHPHINLQSTTNMKILLNSYSKWPKRNQKSEIMCILVKCLSHGLTPFHMSTMTLVTVALEIGSTLTVSSLTDGITPFVIENTLLVSAGVGGKGLNFIALLKPMFHMFLCCSSCVINFINISLLVTCTACSQR